MGKVSHRVPFMTPQSHQTARVKYYETQHQCSRDGSLHPQKAWKFSPGKWGPVEGRRVRMLRESRLSQEGWKRSSGKAKSGDRLGNVQGHAPKNVGTGKGDELPGIINFKRLKTPTKAPGSLLPQEGSTPPEYTVMGAQDRYVITQR